MRKITLLLAATLLPTLSLANGEIPEAALLGLNRLFPTAKVESWSQGRIKGVSGNPLAILVKQEDYPSFPMRMVVLTTTKNGQYRLLAESGSWWYVDRMIEGVKIENGFLIYWIAGSSGAATRSSSEYWFKGVHDHLTLARHMEKSFSESILTHKCLMDFERGKRIETKGRGNAVHDLEKKHFTIDQFAAIGRDMGAGDGIGGYDCD